MLIEASSIWHDSPHHSSIKKLKLEKKGTLIRSGYSLVSIGTERLVASGKVSSDLMEFMSVPYMRGSFSLPCSYGYSLIGTDENTGIPYHVMHPHQDRLVVDPKDIYPLPELTPRFTLISNMETAINIFWDSNPKKSESILILGGGLIAVLTATIFEQFGYHPEIFDISPIRMDTAKSLGLNIGPSMKGYDVIINTTGNSEALQQAIEFGNMNARIIEASWYGKASVTLNLGGKFHYNRQTIRSSQVSNIPPEKSGETIRSRKDLSLKILLDPFYDRVLDHSINFIDLPGAFGAIRNNNFEHLSLLVTY